MNLIIKFKCIIKVIMESYEPSTTKKLLEIIKPIKQFKSNSKILLHSSSPNVNTNDVNSLKCNV